MLINFILIDGHRFGRHLLKEAPVSVIRNSSFQPQESFWFWFFSNVSGLKKPGIRKIKGIKMCWFSGITMNLAVGTVILLHHHLVVDYFSAHPLPTLTRKCALHDSIYFFFIYIFKIYLETSFHFKNIIFFSSIMHIFSFLHAHVYVNVKKWHYDSRALF